MATRFRRCLLTLGLVSLLLGAAGSAQAQGPEEGWQVYTNGNHVNDLVLEGGGALGGGYTWVATEGGVICYSASQQIKFTTADGLADNWVRAVAQDGGGRWWFGTEGGTSVLDDGGTPFDKGDDTWATFTAVDGLAGGSVRSIAVDSGGRLWFGTGWRDGYGGWHGTASVLDHGGTPFDRADDTWITFTTVGAVFAIVEDSRGRLWFAIDVGFREMTPPFNGGVSVLDNGGTPFDERDDTWTTFTTDDGLAADNPGAIAVDSEGQLWFGTKNGASVLDDGGTPFDKGDDTWASFTTADGLASNYVSVIAVDGEGQLWFGTNNGVSVLDDGGTPFDKVDDTWATFTTVDGLASSYVSAIAVDNEGRLWVGTGAGVSVMDDGGTPFDKGDDTWTAFFDADGLASNYVYAIAEDSGRRLWFSTYGSGVSVLDDGGTSFDKGDDTWMTFTTDDGLADNDVEAIAEGSGRRLWFGTYGSGVSVLDNGGTPFDKGDDTWTAFTADDGLVDDSIRAIAMDGEGRFWFCTGAGVSVLDDGGTPFDRADDAWATFTTADGLVRNYVHAIAKDNDRRWWFGTYDGVSVLDHGGTPFDKGDDTWTSFSESDGLADNNVYAIAVDREGRLWFGTFDGGANVLDHGGTPSDKGDDIWTTFTVADGLTDNHVPTIAEDNNGRLWFGTWDGLSVLDYGTTPFDKGDDTWTTFTEADGLVDNWMWAVVKDSAERLWFVFSYSVGVEELVDAVAPASSADSPAHVVDGAIPVSWSASDGASGVFGVTLWARQGRGGTWAETGLSQRGEVTGTFHYTLTQTDRTYYFATVAEDWMGNVEATPSGAGDCSTYYGDTFWAYLPVVLKDVIHYAPPCSESNNHCEDYDSHGNAYGPLEPGVAYQAYPDDEKDYYYFLLPSSASVTVRVTNYSAVGWLVLRDESLGELGWDYEGPGGDDTLEVVLTLAPGKYYVHIHTDADHDTRILYTLQLIN